jgi:hypothetical protein
LAGTTAGALLALLFMAFEAAPGGVWLIAVGGAFGALLRAWQPGRRLGDLIGRRIGWRPFLQIGWMALGAVLGLWLSRPLAWLICPAIFGLLGGGYLGRWLGRALWLAGRQYGWSWERIWAGSSALAAGLLCAAGLYWLGDGPVGVKIGELAGPLQPWLLAQTESLTLASLAFGALTGALGGAVSGLATDLVARAMRLRR